MIELITKYYIKNQSITIEKLKQEVVSTISIRQKKRKDTINIPVEPLKRFLSTDLKVTKTLFTYLVNGRIIITRKVRELLYTECISSRFWI